MSKNVKINNTTYSGVKSVMLLLSDGSGNAQFRDSDEVITKPTAAKTITANGTNIDVTDYAKVTVNVPTTGATPTLSSIDATYANATPVAVGTTLNDLTGITVTAKYSLTGYTGDLTKTVTGFTLSGTLTAGQANTVTVSYTEGDVTKTDTITVTVTSDTVSVTGVTLNTNSGTLAPGNTFQLTATVSPSNATNKSVTWSSSAPTVAKVENGLVTALTAGSANITVTTVDGGFTATYSVTVAVLYSAGTGTTGLTYGSNTLKVTQDTGLTAEPLKILAVITDTATQVGVNTGYYYIFERSGDTWSCSKLGRAGDSGNYADGAYHVPPTVDWTSSYPTVVTVNYETTTDGTYKVSSIVMSSWSGTPEMKFTTTAFTVTVSV